MANSALRISLLGPLQVTVGGEPAEFRTDAERALLAYLAAHQGSPQRRDTLAGLLSPDRADQEALTYLRNRLTRLRGALRDDTAKPPWLDVDRKQIALRAGDDIVIDLTEFEQRLAAVESHPHRQLAGCPTCLARLQEAVTLVRGELLAGLNFPSELWESWLVAQREYILKRALDGMTWLREAQMARNEWEAVLEVAQRQLMMEPWLEAAHRALMQAHYQLGDHNAALAQFAQCEQILWEELAVAPEEETQRLRQAILDHALPASVETEVSDNLPLQADRFFGRDAERTRVIDLLVDPARRLITLVGPGGVGKTRLATEVAGEVKTSFPDGVWFVDVGAVKGGAEQIKIALGEAAGLGGTGRQMTGDQVIAILRDRRILFLFDNCETVLDEIGFIPAWLRRAPGIAVLATSREPLNFQAESVVLLDGLPTGDREMGAAEALFAERARMARADFALSVDSLAQVRRICQIVDGLPLGIALAAAWVRRRSLQQIIDAITSSLDFLSSSLRDVNPRHRSIRAVLETSWQLLASEEQAVLAALSVFPTTFSAEAAAAVAAATLFDLDALCEKSLLQQQHESERYGLHSLVRQFAAEKLANRMPDVERAFADFFYQFAHGHRDDYTQLQPEWSNFSAAITKAHGLGAWQTVLDFVDVLDEPWFRQIRFQEMRGGLTLALDAARALGDRWALARTLLRLGEVEIELNEYGVAEARLAEALQRFTHLEEGLGIAESKYLLGRIKQEQAEDDEAFALFEESRRIFEDEQDLLGIAKNLNLIAVYHIKKYEDFQTASTYLEQAAALQRKQPLSFRYVETLRYLARTKVRTSAFAAAEDHLVEAAEVSRQQNNLGEYAAVLYERVILCKRRDQFDEGLSFGYECLANFNKVGSLRWEALIKTQLGLLHQAKQEYLQGLASIQEGLHIFCELDDLYEQAYCHYYLSQLYAQIGDTAQSLTAKQHAQRLSLVLNDPHLQERFS